MWRSVAEKSALSNLVFCSILAIHIGLSIYGEQKQTDRFLRLQLLHLSRPTKIMVVLF